MNVCAKMLGKQVLCFTWVRGQEWEMDEKAGNSRGVHREGTTGHQGAHAPVVNE